jgi:hypothetical protein
METFAHDKIVNNFNNFIEIFEDLPDLDSSMEVDQTYDEASYDINFVSYAVLMYMKIDYEIKEEK